MGDPKRIEVSGPLVAYRDGFVEELAEQGYTTYGAMHQVWLMAHVSRWLDLEVGDLTADRVEEFVEVRRAAGYTDRLSERALAPLLAICAAWG
jgi:integrase/recombinase XerD